MQLDRTVAATDTQASAQPGALGLGAVVGRYVLLERIGAGSMGVVHAAYDPELDRKVAIKLLAATIAGDAHGSPGIRLLREAQALAKLSHPNVVAVYDVGAHDGQIWIAMEFVAGQTLGAWARARPRRWSELLEVLRDVARGVAAAHAASLVHRDLKPDNVMIADDGRVRVMDFGLAHGRTASSEDPPPHKQLELSTLSMRLTRVGAIQGTPAYMAPEQWLGLEVAAAADQFSWSVIAWELLHGAPPFTGDSAVSLATQVLSGRRGPRPRGRRVPAWLRRILERGLATQPADRWPTMAALIAELGRGRTRARLRQGGLALLVVLALVAAVLGLRRRELAAHEQACAATGAEVTALWNDDARRAVRDAFARTQVGHATLTAEKVMPWLDRQAASLAAARTRLCVEAEIHGDWDGPTRARADWCLEDRRMVLTALIGELRQADAVVVQRAVVAASNLAATSPCLDRDLLLRQPTPPTQGGEVLSDLRAELSRARSLQLAGKYAQGLEVARRTRERAASELDWPPLQAAARQLEGRLLHDTGDYAAAEQALAQAYFAGAEVGAWEVAAAAASELIQTVGNGLARHADGRGWARHATLAIRLAGDPEGLREAARANNLALVDSATGGHADAMALHQRALELRAQALGPDHPELAGSLSNLGLEHDAAGDYASAKRMHTQALAIRERALGPDHPDVARSLGNLAVAHFGSGGYAEALVLHERALAIRERALGPEHAEVVRTLNDLAITHDTMGARDRARALHERALAISERALGPEHPTVAFSLYNLALVYMAEGDTAAARPLLERALAIFERAMGPEHVNVAAALDSLGELHRAAGTVTEGIALSERALAIRERALGSTHPVVAINLSHLGRAYLDLGRRREGLARLERAVTIYTDHPGDQEGEHEAHYNLATALDGADGDPVRAVAEARLARAGYLRAGLSGHANLAAIERLLQARGVALDPE